MAKKRIAVGSGGPKLHANQAAAGIPDSRPFVAPENERHEAGVDRILKCHMRGQLIASLNLDPAVVAALDYWATDEGMAERNAGPMVREASGVTLGKDGWNKSLEQKRDEVKDLGMSLEEARDPFREVAAQHAKPGMHQRFLSAKRVQDEGSTYGFEVVKGADGDPVKCRGMILGQMPEDQAKARRKREQDFGNERLKRVTEQYRHEGGSTAVVD